jgi:hypothetical protein
MRRVLLALAVTASATAAQAQFAQPQTTTCGWEVGRWVCRTPQTQAGPNIVQQGLDAQRQAYDQQQRLYEDRQRAEASRRAQQAYQLDAAEAENRERLRSRVSQAVAEGRCEDAKQEALRYSDMDLAEQAARLCTPR